MTWQPLEFLPGICKVQSHYAAKSQFGYAESQLLRGRYTDGAGIRFVAGLPEKIGGCVLQAGGAMLGVPRSSVEWSDLSGNPLAAFGTSVKLYLYNGIAQTDITPLYVRTTGNLTNPFTTTNGSATVSVASTAHGQKTGDFVELVAGSAVAGLTIAGWFQITVVDANTYTITAPAKANASTTGGGTVAYSYYRVSLSGPYTTVNGSPIVTVTDTAHGTVAGAYVDLSGGSAVAGLTISGSYQVQSVVDANSYTINAGMPANASTTGGGTVSAVYEVYSTTSSLTGGAYGSGIYGTGPYGGVLQIYGSNIGSVWTLYQYGQQLVACLRGGTIYIWDPVLQGRAYPLYNAPAVNLAVLVTPERFIIAMGANDVPMEIAWPDQSDYTNWTPAINNTANSGRQLIGGSGFVGGCVVRDGLSLLFSNTSVFTVNYTGDNYVYATQITAEDAGLVSPSAVNVLEQTAYWFGFSDLWCFDGAVRRLPTDDIRDYIFSIKGGNPGINAAYINKCHVGLLSAKNEVWFFYPSANSTEVDSYVIYHVDQQCFSIGNWQRTVWHDRDIFSIPLAADANGNLYAQETGTDDNGVALPTSLTTSLIDLSNGDRAMDVFGFTPDFERISGTLDLTIQTMDYPEAGATIDGPYTLLGDGSTPLIDLRSNGRLLSFVLSSSSLGTDFRLGLPKIDIQPAGARR